MTKASELQSLIGQEVGVSRWFALDQARIDAFAGLTEDEQFIHVDPERAKTTPFGGTIAHGFLTLSLASAMSYDAVKPLQGVVMGVNYGFDKLRFLAPVPAGSRVRGRFKLLAADVVRRVNQELGDDTVTVVEVQGPRGPSWKHGRLSTRGSRGPRDTYG